MIPSVYFCCPTRLKFKPHAVVPIFSFCKEIIQSTLYIQTEIENRQELLWKIEIISYSKWRTNQEYWHPEPALGFGKLQKQHEIGETLKTISTTP